MEWINLFKKYIFFCFIIFFHFFYAQKYRVIYNMSYKEDSLSNNYKIKKMLLDVNGNVSKFYSYKLYQSDSIVASRERLRDFVPNRSLDYNFMVIKQNDSEKISKIYRILFNIYELSEIKDNFQWSILSETKKINSINCQLAVLNYKGRKWEAWFAPEIPYNEGPYIFNGLPGLIVSMHDNKNNYFFEMLGLVKEYDDIYKDRKVFTSISVNKKQLDKVYIDYYNDPYKEAKMGNVIINFENEKGERITPNWNEVTKYRQMEIKNNNNPIELSDSIKYPEK